MEQDNCSPEKDRDWKDAQLVEVVLAAQEGIPEAVAELQRREKQIDTLSANA